MTISSLVHTNTCTYTHTHTYQHIPSCHDHTKGKKGSQRSEKKLTYLSIKKFKFTVFKKANQTIITYHNIALIGK